MRPNLASQASVTVIATAAVQVEAATAGKSEHWSDLIFD
jgi:hypothetical protein